MHIHLLWKTQPETPPATRIPCPWTQHHQACLSMLHSDYSSLHDLTFCCLYIQAVWTQGQSLLFSMHILPTKQWTISYLINLLLLWAGVLQWFWSALWGLEGQVRKLGKTGVWDTDDPSAMIRRLPTGNSGSEVKQMQCCPDSAQRLGSYGLETGTPSTRAHGGRGVRVGPSLEHDDVSS